MITDPEILAVIATKVSCRIPSTVTIDVKMLARLIVVLVLTSAVSRVISPERAGL